MELRATIELLRKQSIEAGLTVANMTGGNNHSLFLTISYTHILQFPLSYFFLFRQVSHVTLPPSQSPVNSPPTPCPASTPCLPPAVALPLVLLAMSRPHPPIPMPPSPLPTPPPSRRKIKAGCGHPFPKLSPVLITTTTTKAQMGKDSHKDWRALGTSPTHHQGHTPIITTTVQNTVGKRWDLLCNPMGVRDLATGHILRARMFHPPGKFPQLYLQLTPEFGFS